MKLKIGDTFTLTGTGKNAGRTAMCKVVKSNIYDATVAITEILNDKRFARDNKEFTIFYSTKQTIAATRGQTSWRIHDCDKERFDA